ncbi:MAG: hypothetical protein OYL97_02840 [Candidatus Poribacteria bacterium]|nr:hypothetical protein [Candidatus Poribacteria bacterium]
MQKPSVQFPKCLRHRSQDRLPGQMLKRKKYIFASIILICVGFDWLLLWFCRDAFYMLLCDAPYLPEKYAQEYTHLKTLRTPTDLRHHEDVIISIAFSPDNKTLAAVAGKSIHVWDIKTGEHLSALKTDPRWCAVVAFSPDGKTVASVSSRYHSSRIDLLELEHILFLSSRKRKSERLSTLHRSLFIDYTLEMWDIQTGKKRVSFPLATVVPKVLEFSPDATKLLLTTYSCVIEVYDATTGEHLQLSIPSFNGGRHINDATTGEHLQHRTSALVENVMWNTYKVRAFAFSPDGNIFASGGRDRVRRSITVADAEIQLWDIQTGLPLQKLKSPGGRIERLAFSPDSKTLASACGWDYRGCHKYPNKIYIWDVENPRPLSVIQAGEVGEGAIRALRFAPDNRTLASGHTGGRIHLWDITGDAKIKQTYIEK